MNSRLLFAPPLILVELMAFSGCAATVSPTTPIDGGTRESDSPLGPINCWPPCMYRAAAPCLPGSTCSAMEVTGSQIRSCYPNGARIVSDQIGTIVSLEYSIGGMVCIRDELDTASGRGDIVDGAGNTIATYVQTSEARFEIACDGGHHSIDLHAEPCLSELAFVRCDTPGSCP